MTVGTVAVIDAYDAPNLESDLATYRANFGLPACTTANGCFAKLNQAGSAAVASLPSTDPDATASNPGWAAETTLDVEAVSAVCPTCHITVIEATDDDRSNVMNLETAVTEAVNLGIKFVSMSWGSVENSLDATKDGAYFSAKGVAYVASSGDDGYNNTGQSNHSRFGANYPAASPAVTSVGGTTLVPDTSTTRGWLEGAWNELAIGEGAAGSGCSLYETKPSYQAAVPASACTHRAVADVSMDADPETGLAVYEAPFGWFPVGGTSLAAPMVAALYAIAGAPAAGSTPAAYPYNTPSALNDVTLLNNGTCSAAALCNAETGWDGPTGLGTPNGIAAFSATGSPVPAPAPTPTPTPTPTPAPPAPGPVTPAADTLTVAAIPAKSGYVGTRTTVPVSAQSSTGAAVTITASGLPAGVHISGTSITGVPAKPGTFHVSVTASDTAGSRATTGFVWKVHNHTIVATKPLKISGTLKVGKTVTASYGSLKLDSGHGASAHAAVHIQWYANGKPIKNAHGTTLKLTSALHGKHLSFSLTATASHATKYSHTSARSGSVR